MEEIEKLRMKDDIMFKAFFSRKENYKFLKDFIGSILGDKIKKLRDMGVSIDDIIKATSLSKEEIESI